MLYRVFLVLALGLAAARAQQVTPDTQVASQPTIPDSPAGRTFKAWLEAFNSGDRALLDAYYKKYEPGKSAENEMRFRDMTGGFELLKIMKSEPLHLEFVVKERHSDTKAIGKLDVKEGEPAEVADFGLRAIPPGTSLADLDFKIDAATRAKVIDGAIANLNESYVFPETRRTHSDLRSRRR